MSKFRTQRKLIITLVIALLLVSAWTWLSLVRIINKQSVEVLYVVQEPTGRETRGVLGPDESRYLHKFLTEGGLSVRVISRGKRQCDVNVYVVPPLGGKCEVRLTPDSNTCACRLGL